MVKRKSYSSELSKIHDTAVLLLQQLKNFEEPVSMLIADSERLHEIEPLLSGLQKVANVVIPPGKPVDICESCIHQGDSENCISEGSDTIGGIVIKCPGYRKPDSVLPPVTTRQAKARVKKIKATIAGKPDEEHPEENPGNHE